VNEAKLVLEGRVLMKEF